MGRIRQTRYSANDKWADLLFHNVEGPGTSWTNAIALNFDSNDASTLNYNFNAGQLVWVTWTSLYEDEVDLYVFCNGLIANPILISNVTAYQSDATTIIDLSGGSNISPINMGDGPDVSGREGNFIYLSPLFAGSQTYYATFIVPFTGTYGITVEGD